MIVHTLLFGVTILLLKCANAEYNVQKFCQRVTTGTCLPSLDSCQKYYICSENNIVINSTCPDGKAFDKEYQECIPEAASSCNFGSPNPCYKKDQTFAYSTNGCNWYNWCINGEIAGSGMCQINQKFIPANGTCVYGKCETSVSSAVTEVQNICEIVPTGVFFGDFENCRAWHKCVDMTEQKGLCLDNLVYDAATAQCLENKGNICQRTQNIVDNTASGPPATPCTNVNQIVPDKNICSYYYTCEANIQGPGNTFRWVQRKCQNQYFDVISKKCNVIVAARSYTGCDRCEFKAGIAKTYWANSVDPDCNEYFTCSKGKQMNPEIRACKGDNYFDERTQSCSGHTLDFPKYVASNGACQNYTCNDQLECKLAGAEAEQNGSGNGGQQQGNGGQEQGNGGKQEGNGGQQQGNGGEQQGNGGEQQGNGGQQETNGGKQETNDGKQEGSDGQQQGNDGEKVDTDGSTGTEKGDGKTPNAQTS